MTNDLKLENKQGENNMSLRYFNMRYLLLTYEYILSSFRLPFVDIVKAVVSFELPSLLEAYKTTVYFVPLDKSCTV